MPVSRKRKKKSSGRRSAAPPVLRTTIATPPANLLREMADYRHKLDERRTVLAAAAAGPLVDALLAAVPERSDDELEDDFCLRYGAALARYEDVPVEDLINPEDFVRAVLSVLDERLHEAEESGDDVTAVQRLLAVVVGVLPMPLSEAARDVVAAHLAGDTAQRATRGRAVTGPVLWARDGYGTRWAVVAPFAAAAGPDRWYLWDVDTCGYEAVTVHSGFHPSAETALTEWQAAVGAAADGAALNPVDDTETLGELLTGELESIRIGGEDQAQYAEFLRSRRLGRTVRETTGRIRGRDDARLAVDDAKELFTRRLRQLGHQHRPAGAEAGDEPVDAAELATEMAESWPPHDRPHLYAFCSPHKVAATVLHLRDYYQDDFAADILAVLPEWICFLAEHTGMTADLTERCLAYASGDREFPGLLDHRGEPNPLARVAE
jgi:hypothetical protein